MLELAVPKIRELVNLHNIEYYTFGSTEGTTILVYINYYPCEIDNNKMKYYEGTGYDYDVALFLAIESLLKEVK